MRPAAGGGSAAARAVLETHVPDGRVPLYVQPEWRERLPWLLQGTTARGTAAEPFDLGLYGATPVRTAMDRWRQLLRETGFRRGVHARQVHGRHVRVHDSGERGLLVGEGLDGHVATQAGVLLTVSVADCVPIFLVAPQARAVGVLHGGWRGVAAGVLAEGVRVLCDAAAVEPSALLVHFGPAICGACYEVGPEVHEALGLPVPEGNTPVDLRAVLADQARGLGVPEAALTVSAFCTRCGDSPFFSHRGGDAARQMALLGVRSAAA